MDEEKFQALLIDLGQCILKNEKYRDREWDAVALVVTLTETDNGSAGYTYDGENWRAASMGGDEFFDLCEDLQEITRTPSGETWKQALIHITKPGPQINVQFEYDDPRRWSLKKVSLDLKDYAMSLRPPRDG